MHRLLLLAALTVAAHAQWTLQQSSTTADLRGIDNVGNGIAWASGTNGTILRTTDSGLHWHLCTIPPNAEHLDFRGIQAFDATTAIAMSSGTGDLSRLYKTTDACQSWTLLFTNPDTAGFWDALIVESEGGRSLGSNALLLGDPVGGRFALWQVQLHAQPTEPPSIKRLYAPAALKGEAAFAASNSSMFVFDHEWGYWIATGGVDGSRMIHKIVHGNTELGWGAFHFSALPMGTHTESSGAFSLTFAETVDDTPDQFGNYPHHLSNVAVAVGGDYLKPNDPTATAAFTTDGGKTWHPATTQPHGYRSAVAYDPTTRIWITVGPNGTDISTDDGRNWHPLTPTKDDSPDADQHWNALSLPYVVGPHGRIGLLNPSALQPTGKVP